MGFFGEDRDGRFADSADIQRGGFYRKGGVYLGLGRSIGRKLFYNGEGASIIFGKPEVGKTTKLIIPTLLTYKKGSVVVSDPKGTLTAQTMRRRKELGNKVVVLNPWSEEMKESLGVDYGDTPFNPLSILEASDDVGRVKDNSDRIAILLCPPATSGDPYWTDAARGILSGVLTYLRFSPIHKCTLTELYRVVHSTIEGWIELATDMKDFRGVDLTTQANKILAPLENPRQWTGVDGALKAAVAIYDADKPLGKHVSPPDPVPSSGRELMPYDPKIAADAEPNYFDVNRLKSEKITVYIVIPSNRRDANKQWLSLVLSMCAEAIGQGRYTHPILLVMEEMGNLGYLPMQRFLAELREAGLRAICTLQTIRQLREIYGIEGAQNIIDLCAVRHFLRVDDVETAREISQTLGTFEYREYDDQDRIAVRENRPVMAEHQILRMPESEQIILASGSTPPIRSKLKPFYEVPKWERMTDENPLRGESNHEKAAKVGRSILEGISNGLLIGLPLFLLGYVALYMSSNALLYFGIAVALAALLYFRPVSSRTWSALFIPGKNKGGMNSGGVGVLSNAVGGLWTGAAAPLIGVLIKSLKWVAIGITFLIILETMGYIETKYVSIVTLLIINDVMNWFS